MHAVLHKRTHQVPEKKGFFGFSFPRGSGEVGRRYGCGGCAHASCRADEGPQRWILPPPNILEARKQSHFFQLAECANYTNEAKLMSKDGDFAMSMALAAPSPAQKQTHPWARAIFLPRSKRENKAIPEVRRTDGVTSRNHWEISRDSKARLGQNSAHIEAYSALNSRAARGSSSGSVPIWFIV